MDRNDHQDLSSAERDVDTHTHQCPDRIISVFHPHARTISEGNPNQNRFRFKDRS
jgi:hypothetical protein